MKAIGYIRVSTEEQASQGHGLEVQANAIREFSSADTIELVDIASDAGASGSNGLEARAGLMNAIARLEAGEAERLLVYRLDRLARDLVLQELLIARLRAAGTPVVSVTEPDVDGDTDDPTKVLVRQILGALSQYERTLIRARMAAGKAVKAARGGYVGGQPGYGSRVVDGELAIDDEEAEVVELIQSLRTQGCSLRTISRALDERGLRPRRGSKWAPKVVRSILMRSYAGS